jgi:hypothetical protein
MAVTTTTVATVVTTAMVVHGDNRNPAGFSRSERKEGREGRKEPSESVNPEPPVL